MPERFTKDRGLESDDTLFLPYGAGFLYTGDRIPKGFYDDNGKFVGNDEATKEKVKERILKKFEKVMRAYRGGNDRGLLPRRIIGAIAVGNNTLLLRIEDEYKKINATKERVA